MKIFEHAFLKIKELDTEYVNGKRHYIVGSKLYPSVTTVLSGHSKPALEAWKKRVGEQKAEQISYAARERGTALHSVLETYLLNKPVDFSGAMPTTIDLFEQVKPVLDNHIGKIYGIESPLYSHRLRTAGRVDFAADYDGEPAIIDFKTATRPKVHKYMHSAFMQEATYSYMIFEMFGLYVPKLVTIVACDEADGAQIFIEKGSDWLPKAIALCEQYHSNN